MSSGTPLRAEVSVSAIAGKHGLAGAHVGTNGVGDTGVWGVDDAGRITFVITKSKYQQRESEK